MPAAAMIEWRVDASESAVGAFNPNSGARWAKALPEELIGTSSTQRELFGALQVLKQWGAGATGRSVRLCMDSFAATRNLLKGGGPVPQLCDLTKDIWHTSEKLGVRLIPEWVEREQNTEADRLSKAWEDWYRLGQRARDAVQYMLADQKHPEHRAAKVVNVPFNQIRNVLHRAKAEREVLCLIHPVWQAQSWWQHLEAACVGSAPLGLAAAALAPPEGGDPWEGKPRWRLDASVPRSSLLYSSSRLMNGSLKAAFVDLLTALEAEEPNSVYAPSAGAQAAAGTNPQRPPEAPKQQAVPAPDPDVQ